MQVRSQSLVAAGFAAILLVSVPASAADDDLSVAHVQSDDENVKVLVSVPEQVDPSEAVVVDTSTSMAGTRVVAAQSAALTFVDAVPADVLVGIVTFNGTVTTDLKPTTDRDAARTVLNDLSLSGHTYLNDALIQAVKVAGSAGQRNVLVLSDGEDNSQTPVSQAVKAVKASGVLVDAVALDFVGGDTKALNELATARGGEVIAADPDSLTAAFDAEAESLGRQLLITAPIPASVTGSQVTIKVAARTFAASTHAKIRDEAVLPPPASEVAVPTEASGFEVSQTVMYVGIGAIGLGLLVVLGSLMSSAASPKAGPSAEARIAAYRVGGTASATDSAGGETVMSLDNAKSAAASVLHRNLGLEAKINHRLVAAGSALKAAEWVLIHGGIAIVSGLVGALLGQGDVLFILLFLVTGLVIPWLWLGRQRKKRISAFNSQLADTLTLISGSLSAGMSLAQSINTVVLEGREPVAGEFKQALIQSRLGVPLVDALEDVAVRTESQDFAWVVMAIRIQRQVGGNLTELLTTVAATLRERDYLRRQVQTLSAEGRLSGWILGALPVGMFVYMLMFRREYVSPLWTEAMGLVMLAGAVVLLAFGAFVMSRIVKVEV